MGTALQLLVEKPSPLAIPEAEPPPKLAEGAPKPEAEGPPKLAAAPARLLPWLLNTELEAAAAEVGPPKEAPRCEEEELTAGFPLFVAPIPPKDTELPPKPYATGLFVLLLDAAAP